MCPSTREIVVYRLDAGPVMTRVFGATLSESPTCKWFVAGLPAGAYHVTLTTAEGSGGTEAFEILPQQTTRVVIAPPVVRVSGHVRRLDEPVAGARISFQSIQSRDTAEATTDRFGEYSVTLAKAGDYFVVATDPQFLEERSQRFSEGLNTLNWNIKDVGSVVVRFKGLNGAEPARAEIKGTDTSSFWSMQPIQPSQTRAVWQGLAFGEYIVTATQSGWASDAVTVTISRDRLRAEIELELHPTNLRLFLTDQLGNPVENAAFSPRIPVPQTVRPGLYLFEGMPAKQALIILAPSFVPLCRITSTNADAHITLAAGSTVTFRFNEGRQLDLGSASVHGIPGSDCPVPLSVFRMGQLGGPSSDPNALMVQDFPSSGRLRLVLRDRTLDVLILPDGTAHLR
jgi:hypothetical protein